MVLKKVAPSQLFTLGCHGHNLCVSRPMFPRFLVAASISLSCCIFIEPSITCKCTLPHVIVLVKTFLDIQSLFAIAIQCPLMLFRLKRCLSSFCGLLLQSLSYFTSSTPANNPVLNSIAVTFL